MALLTVGNKTIHIPDKGSSCQLWKTYYKELLHYGRNTAKTAWLLTWNENGSSSCTTNADFNKWLKRNDIDVSSAATRAVADLSAIQGNILGFGKKLSGVASVTPLILIAAGLGTSVLLFIILYNTIKKNDVDAGDVAALFPQTRVTAIASKL